MAKFIYTVSFVLHFGRMPKDDDLLIAPLTMGNAWKMGTYRFVLVPVDK